MRRRSVSSTAPNHWHTAQTASSILSSSPCLNPFLTTTPISARCFSTASPVRAKDEVSDVHDPVEDEIKASIEKKYQESLGLKSGRRRAEATAARVEARAQRKRDQVETISKSALSSSPRPARQAIQKTALMRDLRTPIVEEPAAQSAPAALDDPSLEALNARVADMRAKLAEAEAINWKYVFEETSRSFSIKDMPNYLSMNTHRRKQEAKKADEERIASLKQVRCDEKAHFKETKQLAESIVALEAFIKQQQHVKSKTKSKTKSKIEGNMESKTESKAGTGAPTKDGAKLVENAEDKRQRLEAIQTRRAELLKRKDDIAVKMAQLTAATISSPAPGKKWQAKLRLFVPKGKKFVIDRFLTVNFDAPDYELAWQIQAMRVRLRKFTPPLDSLPLPVKMSNHEQLRMWLKVLVSRYQDKTDVQAGLIDAEGGEWEELSLEEMQRMAKPMNEMPEKERESNVPFGEMTMGQRKAQKWERRAREEELRRARRERQVARRRAYAKDLEQLQLKGMYPAAVKRAEKRLAAKAAERAAWLLKQPPSPSPLLSPSPSPSPPPPDSQPPVRVVLAKTSWTPPENREYEPQLRIRTINASKGDPVVRANKDPKRSSPQPPTESTQLRLKRNTRKVYPSTLRKMVRGYSSSSQPRSPPPAPFPADDDTPPETQLSAKEKEARDAREIAEHNLRAVELGWGDESDRRAAREYLATRTPQWQTPSRAHLEPYDVRTPSALSQKGIVPQWCIDLDKELSTQRFEAENAVELRLIRREAAEEAAALALEGKSEFVPTIRSVFRVSPAGSREEAVGRQLARQRRRYSTSSLSSSSSLADLNAQLEAKEEQARELDPSSSQPNSTPLPTHLPHLTKTGTAHMVAITHKAHTSRTAIAVGTVFFSNPTPLSLITSNTLKKGDVLSVSRIAGIMAAKKCPEIVPLCHPITLTHVGVEVRTFPPSTSSSSATSGSASSMPTSPSVSRANSGDDFGHGGVQIECKVACTGATGVEMEALTAVMGAALSVVDMCKAVDKFQRIGEVRVVLKEGGKSGVWREEGWGSWQTQGGE